jgi:CheY-like chemotaxis protein
MDIVMPRLDGVEAIRAIRLAGNNTPIIALSGSALERDREHIGLAGSDDFLAKPFDPVELHALLEKHLKIKIALDYALVREHTMEVIPLTKIPPKQTLDALHRMAIIGDMRAIIDSIEELSGNGYPECAHNLRFLAVQFKDVQILNLIEQWLLDQQPEVEGSLE